MELKKFKAIATKKIEKSSSKKIVKKDKYESYSFKFFARNLTDAIRFAEKEAKKGLSLFTSLKVSEA